jgi:AraC-like DNA-binding protein
MVDSIYEGRLSDSPYIEILWRGQAQRDHMPVCPADSHWNLLFMTHHESVRVSVEGPTTKAITKTQFEGAEFFVIKFKLGTFLPNLSVKNLQNDVLFLPEASRRAFWLNGFAWQLPDFENAETFVERLVREGLLVHDGVIDTALQNQLPEISERTVRRRFLQATGLTQGTIHQIERSKLAMSLLQQGESILDVVYQAGYADQPHLTRSLKRFTGQTPAQIAQTVELDNA